jgi:hypothetical protein
MSSLFLYFLVKHTEIFLFLYLKAFVFLGTLFRYAIVVINYLVSMGKQWENKCTYTTINIQIYQALCFMSIL